MASLKYTDEVCRKICEEKDLKYIQIISVKKKNRTRRLVEFICNKHNDKGVQSITVEKLASTKKPCKYCNHSKLRETFKEEVEGLNPDIEVLGKYVNWDTTVRCRCKIDGNEWDALPSVLLYGGGCKICGYRKTWDARGRKTTDDIVKEMEIVNPNIIIAGEYKGSHDYIKCKCKLDGHEWESIVANLLNGSAGCPKCTARRIRERCGMGHDEFVKRLNKNYPHIELIDTYQNSITKLKFKCTIHNETFYSTPKEFLYTRRVGCPKCTESNGEREMNNILRSLGLNIKTQHKLPGCKNKLPLRFDAYDITHNIAFEFQGGQHYYPVDFAGKGDEWAAKEFNITQKRDSIKRKYCNQHNIKLIEVPYWEYDNGTMKEYIVRQLKT